MVTVKLLLDTHKPTKKTSFRYALESPTRKKHQYDQQKFYLRKDQWDNDKKIIKSNHPNTTTLNRQFIKDFADL